MAVGIRTHDQLRAVWKARDKDLQPVRGYVAFGAADPQRRTVQERWFFVSGHQLFYTASRESAEYSGVYLADVFCPVITQVTEATLMEFCAVGEKSYALHLRGLLIPELKILLCPDSLEDRRQWLDKLEIAGLAVPRRGTPPVLRKKPVRCLTAIINGAFVDRNGLHVHGRDVRWRRLWHTAMKSARRQPHAQQTNKRIEAMQKLVESEKKYVQDLSTLVNFYYRQFKMAMALGHLSLTNDQVETIFLNSEALLVLHRVTLLCMEHAISSPSPNFGHMFSCLLPLMKLYGDFVRNHQKCLDTLDHCLSHPTLSDFLENQHYSKDADAMQLKHLLYTPVTRTDIYLASIEEILKYTHTGHIDYKPLQVILQGLLDLKSKLPRQFSSFEEYREMMDIVRQVGPKGFLVMAPDCSLLLEDETQLPPYSNWIKASIRKRTIHCYLYSKALIMTSFDKKVQNQVLPLSGATVYEHISRAGKVTTSTDPDLETRALKVYSPEGPRTGIVLVFDSPASKSKWLEKLTAVIADCTPSPDAGGLLTSSTAVLPRKNSSVMFGTDMLQSSPQYFSVPLLLSFLTNPPDSHFQSTILLTYRMFTNAHEVLDVLIESHRRELNERVCRENFPQLSLSAGTLRFFNIVKTWVSQYYLDFHHDIALKNLLIGYLSELKSNKLVVEKECELVDSILKVVTERGHIPVTRKSKQKILITRPMQRPVPISFMEIPTDIAAEQLTRVEHEFYSRIKPYELLQQKWTKKNKGELSPNVCYCIDRFNTVTRWVTKEILSYDHTRQRAAAISKMVQVAMMSLKLNNFATVFQITAAINAMPVQRLKKSWEQIHHTVIETFKELQEITNIQGSKAYRERQKCCAPPSVPYLGAYLSQLVIIEVGMPTFVESPPEHINYPKLLKLASIIEEVTRFQHPKYTISFDASVLAYLDRALESSASFDDDQQYSCSLMLEPRVTTD